MGIQKIQLSNFTVFDYMEIDFCEGINILIGENGTGKTHLMKVLYSACQAARKDISFSHKLVKVFKPDDLEIKRLANKKGRKTGNKVSVKVSSNDLCISMEFSNQTRKWQADVQGEEAWEDQLTDLSSTFIPAKEILSNAWHLEAAVNKNNVDFDDTYVDIITSAKINISESESDNAKKLLEKIEKTVNAKVVVSEEKFYLSYSKPSRIEFNLVAEGIRKLALLWQLAQNGTLEKGSILFWDEPEANMNPVHIPLIVEILLELQRSGVQIFISTHDYILAKYFEVKRIEQDDIAFYSMYNSNNAVLCEKNSSFRELANNPIVSAFNELLDEVYNKKLGE